SSSLDAASVSMFSASVRGGGSPSSFTSSATRLVTASFMRVPSCEVRMAPMCSSALRSTTVAKSSILASTLGATSGAFVTAGAGSHAIAGDWLMVQFYQNFQNVQIELKVDYRLQHGGAPGAISAA